MGVMKKFCYLFTVFSLMLFTSCSEKPSKVEISENKKELMSELEQLHTDGLISQQNLTDAIDNIVSFEQKGFFSQYWWVILFIFLSIVLITIIAAVAIQEEEELAEPIKKSSAYRMVAFLGFLGGHNIYLNKHSWIGVITILLTIVFFFWNYNYVMYFYNLPNVFFIPGFNCIHLEEMGTFYGWQAILIALYIFNLLTGIVFTPFWVYQFNGNYFRKHKDNDAILNGSTLDVDRFYNSKLIPHMDDIKEDVKSVKDVLKDDSYTIEEDGDEKISGFFKNIFTLGKSSELKNKIQRLRALHSCCELLQDDLNTLDMDNYRLYSYLNHYRVAAYRNLYLAKELIRVIKENVSSQQQKLIKDEFPNLMKPQNGASLNVHFDSSQVSFDSERFFDTLGDSFTKSFDPINAKLKNEKEITKQDILSAGFEFAFDSVIAGIEGIIDQYQKVSASLKEVQTQINKAVMYLDKAFPAIIRYEAELARQSEIMIALSQFNKAFIIAYEPMRQKIFGYPTFRQFLHGIDKSQEYFNSVELRKDIQHLIMVCSEYNKVYNTKTERNADKMEKPSTRSTAAKAQATPMATKSQCIPEKKTVMNRGNILATIRRALNSKYINEGNSLSFLDLTPDSTSIEHLCKELSTMAGRKIGSKEVSRCKNIKEIIDLVIG